MRFSYNYDKLYFATHYICARANEKGYTIDDVQLNKILWYADAFRYMVKGQPITGARYKRKPMGPVASGHAKAIRELTEHEKVREGFAQKDGDFVRVIDSIDEPDTKVFSKAELKLFNQVQDYVAREVSTSEISEQSHGDIWRLAKDGEEIPLYTIFAESLGTPTPAEIRDALEGLS